MLEIYGVNAEDETVEGQKCSYEFTTPTCWQVHKENLQKCRKKIPYMNLIWQLFAKKLIIFFMLAPEPLVNINSTYEMIETDFYRMNVTWDLPKYQPDYYNVSLNLNSKGNVVSQNVSGVSAQ